MVGNSNGTVSPRRRLLDGSGCIGQGVHIAHNGMQMQLHPLFSGYLILPLGHLPRHNGSRLQYRFIIKFIDGHSALHLQYRANLDLFQNRLRFFVFHKAVDPHRAGIIGHIKIDDPGIALFQFLMLYTENSSLNRNRTKIQADIFHRGRRIFKGSAVNG